MKIIQSIFIVLFLSVSCTSKQENKTDSVNTPSKIISISQAQTLPLGSEVTIKGTVTVASGTFSSSRPFGYALQDSSGGIYIIDSVPPMQNEFKLGELVKVTGIMDKTDSLLVVKEISASKEGKGNKITPLSLKTGDVDEQHEGMMIHTSGIIDSLANDSPFGYKVYIDDGSGRLNIFVNTSTEMLDDTKEWRISDSLSVIGFSARYNYEYESNPRMKSDLKVFPKN